MIPAQKQSLLSQSRSAELLLPETLFRSDRLIV
jgi:hypothetical protein